MKLVYRKLHYLPKLMDELIAIPELQPFVKDGEKKAKFILQGDGENIYLFVPDDAPIDKMEQVIQAHVPSPLPVFEPVEEEKTALAEAIIDLETRLSALEAKLNA